MLLGVIGDDFTGSSDIANTLALGGMRTVLYSGVPEGAADAAVEAGVVALKSRSIPVGQAVAQSLTALEWLREQGCSQFVFKYCSTFDSTREGNIGPVADALASALGADRVVVCPAYPSLKRSIYAGHLFVGDRLLSESGMEHHPLNPMTDADIRRWLGYQSRSQVGHVPAATILKGREAIRAALDAEHAAGAGLIVTDVIRDEDLIEIGAAVADLPLLTGGSGIALGLPENFRMRGLIGKQSTTWEGVAGRGAIIAGSVSAATREQVAHYRGLGPALEVKPEALMDGAATVESALDWLLAQPDGAPMIYSTAEPDAVKAAQAKYGREALAARIEGLWAELARRLVEAGFTRLVVAGGETSGAVVEALDIEAMEIGPEIDPGVPALKVSGRPLALALKSGNFGGRDFFERAQRRLEG
jgi:3-dehydrotetronate 4-kinase